MYALRQQLDCQSWGEAMPVTPFTVTFFDHYSARMKYERELSLAELKEIIETEHAERKDLLRWLKLARFGTVATAKGSLRHDANVNWVTGCEADYDGEQISVDHAKDILIKADIEALIYSSPSYLPDRPRWRIVCPFSTRLQAERRAQMVARLNGLFGGALAPESFTLSQSYYFGHVVDADGKPIVHKSNGADIDILPTEVRIELIEGRPLDLADDLDAGAIGKAGRKAAGSSPTHRGNGHDYTETDELIRRIISSDSLHLSVTSFTGRYARADHSEVAQRMCREIISALMHAHTGKRADEYRWREPGELQAVDDIFVKERAKPEHQQQNKPPTTTPYNFSKLRGRTFMPLTWLVPNNIPEGTTLLAGKPKIGKSWLMLATVLAMARNEVVLDQMCPRRNVLYFALEDTPRRMKNRTETLLISEADWPSNAWITHELPNLDRGCIERLQQHHEAMPEINVMIIDTLAAIRGKKLKDEEPYAADYRTMNALAEFGRATGISIIVVHHVRKQSAEDVFDTISGTMGLSAAADTLVVLTRAGEQLRLVVRGRDVEPEDKVVDFDPMTGGWTVVGDYEGDQTAATSTQTLILSALGTAKMGMKPAEIAKATGLPADNVRHALRRMSKINKVQHTQYGTYEARMTADRKV
jgi:hypothetical protein